MFLDIAEQETEIIPEICDLSSYAVEQVAGGPEVTNDPGQ